MRPPILNLLLVDMTVPTVGGRSIRSMEPMKGLVHVLQKAGARTQDKQLMDRNRSRHALVSAFTIMEALQVGKRLAIKSTKNLRSVLSGLWKARVCPCTELGSGLTDGLELWQPHHNR